MWPTEGGCGDKETSVFSRMSFFQIHDTYVFTFTLSSSVFFYVCCMYSTMCHAVLLMWLICVFATFLTQNKQKPQNLSFIADEKYLLSCSSLTFLLLWCYSKEIFRKTLLLLCVNFHFDVPYMGLLKMMHV